MPASPLAYLKKPHDQVPPNFLHTLPVATVRPPLTAMQYVMYFRLYEWHQVFT